MKTHPETDDICCPRLEPGQWDEKIFEWTDKKFIKENVLTFFYMPVNFGGVMKKLDQKIRMANAGIPDNLCLSDHTSIWNMDLYLAVDRDIPGAQNVTLSGTFFSRVYEGPYQDTSKWCKEYESEATSRGFKIKKWFMWYTTCPKCAKKYGKNYVVILSQVERLLQETDKISSTSNIL